MKSRKAQESKSKILKAFHKKGQGPKGAMLKKAQEEIVGFSMIIIIVAIILVIFLSFSLRPSQKSTVESYEVEGFLNALMQKTSDCRSVDNLKYYSVKELMFQCYSNEQCMDGKETCNILLNEIGSISNQSWNIGNDSAIKGYSLNISVDGEPLKFVGYGNRTRSSKKGTVQDDLIMHGRIFRLEFMAYY